MKKKNSKPSLTNSTKHLLKCPVTKPSFPLYSSPNISFKTTPKLQTQPQNFFCLFVKKNGPLFFCLAGWTSHSIDATDEIFILSKIYSSQSYFLWHATPHFWTKTPPYPSYCHSHFSHGSYYFAPKKCSKFKLLREEFWFSKKSLEEEEEILREIKQEPTKKKRSLEEWIRS